MIRISQKIKLFFVPLIPLILIGALFLMRASFRMRVFYGDRSNALNILNGIVQGLSTIVAIVFSIIIVVVQTTLGRYVSRAIRYVISDWINLLMLCLYVFTIICALCTMWIINYGTWTLWVDVTMIASILCLGALIPFFMRMPRSLNPTLIMDQVKKEILDGCNIKDFSLMTDKTNLLFSMIEKSIETGDVEYAFEGFRFLEEVIKLEDSRENRWMFFDLMQSLLDNLGMKVVKKNPNVTLRIFDVYTKLTDKMKATPPIFANVANRIVRSVVEICSEALPYRFVSALLLKASHMIIDIYKSYVLLDYYVLEKDFLDQSLRDVLGMSKGMRAFDAFPVGFFTNHVIIELLKNRKNKEALHMTEVIYGEAKGSSWVKLSFIGLILDSKVEEFDDFASKSLRILKKKFAPFTIDVVYDPQKKSGTETSVKPDGLMEIRTGDKKREEAALWMKQNLIY